MTNQALRNASWIALPILLLTLATTQIACGDVEASQQAAEEIALREAAAAELERQLAIDRAAFDEREGRLAEVAESLDAQEQELGDRIAELERRQRQLERRASEIEARSATVATSESRLAAERQALAESRAQLDRETERVAEAERRSETRREPPPVYVEAELEAGTLFDVEFLSTLTSGSSRVGETFRTRLAEDLLTRDGVVAAPAGAELVGTVVEAVPLKKVGGRARLGLRFDQLVLPSGTTVEIAASFYGENREGRRDAAKIGGAAVGGAILGRILDSDDDRGTVLGAVIGAAAGTAIAAGGREVEIPAGSRVTLQLDQPAVVLLPWRSSHAER